MLWVCSPLDDPDWNFTSPSKAPCRQKGEIALCSVPLLHPNMVSASREQWLKKDFKNRHYLSSGRAIKRNTSQVVSVNTITLQIQRKKKQITLGRPDLQTGSNYFAMFSLPLSHTSTKLHTCTHSHTYILPQKQKFVDMCMSSLAHIHTHTHIHMLTHTQNLLSMFLCKGTCPHSHFYTFFCTAMALSFVHTHTKHKMQTQCDNCRRKIRSLNAIVVGIYLEKKFQYLFQTHSV